MRMQRRLRFNPDRALAFLLRAENACKYRHVRDKSVLTLAMLGLRKIFPTSTRIYWLPRPSLRIPMHDPGLS